MDIKRKLFCAVFAVVIAMGASAQTWGNGLVLDVVNLPVEALIKYNKGGANEIMKCMERFVDLSYKYAFVSNDLFPMPNQFNNLLPANVNEIMVGVMGYPERGRIIVAQVIYNGIYFVIILARNITDVPVTAEMPMSRMNYEKYNSLRRTNVVDFIQRNNVDKFKLRETLNRNKW